MPSGAVIVNGVAVSEEVLSKVAEVISASPRPTGLPCAAHRERAMGKLRSYRRYRLKTGYGLSIGQFEDMLRQQGGRCAICLEPLSEGKKAACIDHDHKTGRVRGILCRWCNTQLGILKDREQIERALRYIGYQHA